MIGKLILYELKKSVGGKFFRISLVTLLLLNMLMLMGIHDYIEMQKWIEDGTFMEDSLAVEDRNFWGVRAGARSATRNMAEDYAVLAELTVEEREAFKNCMEEKYGEGILENTEFMPMDEMFVYPGYLGEGQCDYESISNYQLIEKYNLEYEKSRNRAVKAAEVFEEDALEEGDNYAVRRNSQIMHLYSVPRGKISGFDRGWTEMLFETHTILLAFLMILLSSTTNFTREQEGQTLMLLHTAKNGKGKTLAAKYLAGAIVAAVLPVLFGAVSFAAIYFKGGFCGMSQPIGVLEQMRMCPYPFTVWQFALVMLGGQIFAAVIFSVVLNTVSALSKSSIVSCAVGVLLFGGCTFLMYNPPKSEWLAGPLALAKSQRFFSSYYTANIFGYPILWIIVEAVLWIVLATGCIAVGHKYYHRKRRKL